MPFGKQEKLGFISKISDATTIASSKIRPIINILDERPILDSELLTLIDWTSKYYYHPIGEVFAAAVPIYLRQSKYPKIAKEDSASKPLALETRKKLTKEQHQSFKNISNAMIKKEPIVLNGITGSGKTEIYLQAIDAVLRQGKQALVLVPEIGLTPQAIERFTSRFNVPIYALHSSLTDKERLHAWRQRR